MKNNSILISLGDKMNGFAPIPILKKIEKSQWWNEQQLEDLQLSFLKKLLHHCLSHVPFYQKCFQANNLSLNDFQSLKDLSMLPITDKSIINLQASDFISHIAKKPYVWLKTTGSTGVPFSFVRTRLAQSYKLASRIRFRNWYGVGRCDKLINVAGIPSYANNIVEELKHQIHFLATSKKEIYASEINDVKIPEIITLFNQFKPKALMGYPSGIASLASKIKGAAELRYVPKAIFTNSESLIPYQREQIIETFGIIPKSDYVATEGSIAHECPEGGLHIDMEEAIVEIVNMDENGFGDVLITFLHTFDFPLIRYKIGDKAKWKSENCKCGRGLKMIDNMVGRASDVIKLKNGKEYSAANINMRIAHFPFIGEIEQYQIVQNNISAVTLRIVKKNICKDSSIVTFKNEMEQIFTGCAVNVEICSELQRNEGEKIRTIIAL